MCFSQTNKPLETLGCWWAVENTFSAYLQKLLGFRPVVPLLAVNTLPVSVSGEKEKKVHRFELFSTSVLFTLDPADKVYVFVPSAVPSRPSSFASFLVFCATCDTAFMLKRIQAWPGLKAGGQRHSVHGGLAFFPQISSYTQKGWPPNFPAAQAWLQATCWAPVGGCQGMGTYCGGLPREILTLCPLIADGLRFHLGPSQTRSFINF